MLDLGYICATVLLKSFRALERAVKFGRVLSCHQGDLLAMPESLSKSEEVWASNITYIAKTSPFLLLLGWVIRKE